LTAGRWLNVFGLVLAILLIGTLLVVLTMSVGCLNPDNTNYPITHPCYDWVAATTKSVSPK
jgi:hypothetical protein